MTEPDEGPGWQVRSGGGLLIHAPMSDERRAIIDREAEKERKAAEFEEEQRRQAALERRWELERQGVVPHTVQDVLARLSYAADRTDRIEARKERDAAERLGLPGPRLNRWEVKASVAAAEAERETTPASKADLGRLEQVVTGLKSKLYALGGRPL